MPMKHFLCSSLLAVVQATLSVLFFGMGCTPKPPEHGIAFVIELQPVEGITAPAMHTMLGPTQQVYRKRLDHVRIRAYVEAAGTNRIQIKLPPLPPGELEVVRQVIQRNGVLEFRLVHEESGKLTQQGIIPPDYELKKVTLSAPGGGQQIRQVLVEKKPVPQLSGKNIKGAFVTRDSMGRPEIAFKLDSAGTKVFGDVTSANIGRQLAILVDGDLYSAPVIRTPITEGNGVISGSFDAKEAFDLVSRLQNPLEVPVKLVEERSY
jgi:SecD/SecF fusion protein